MHVGCRIPSPGAAAAAALLLISCVAKGQDTDFFYTGELFENGVAAEGPFDFQVSLFDLAEGGIPLAPDLVLSNQSVSRGVFSLHLDFGDTSALANRLWLEIGVRPAGETAISILAPRLEIQALPRTVLALDVETDSVDSASIADGSVVSSDIAAAVIGALQIADDGVSGSDIAAGAIDTDKLAGGAIGAGHIAANGVTAQDLATDSVGSSEVIAGAVGAAEIASGAVGASELSSDSVGPSDIAPEAVTSAKISTNAVGSEEILDGSITAPDYNNATVQRRVSVACLPNFGVFSVGLVGTTNCVPDDPGFRDFGLHLEFEVGVFNGDDDTATLRPVSDHLCFLSGVNLSGADSGTDRASCELKNTGGTWTLEAITNNQADATCRAICLPMDGVSP
ncbi:MAG: hypothetical protein QNJ40_05320 [Xanthomonadales bacterium]|nr:hypothetical protein [Xanthomonadales bacterium]